MVSGTSAVLQELRAQLKGHKAFGSNFDSAGPDLGWHGKLQTIALAIQFSELRVRGV